MKNLRLFSTTAEADEAYANDYEEPWTSLTDENGEVRYNKDQRELLRTPLTFEVISAGTVGCINMASDTPQLEWRKNDGDWTAYEDEFSLGVAAGDSVQFRGNNVVGGTLQGIIFMTTTCVFSLKGNIMSLIDKENFSELKTLTGGTEFNGLFSGIVGLTDASELMLPATALSNSCYLEMFNNCTSLTGAPSLPATVLANNCYWGMFKSCSSLSSAPALPARTLAQACYRNMFENCSSLVSAPALPATALTQGCYFDMFYGCTALTIAPDLPAPVLVETCYEEMFQGCTSLSSVKCLATDISDNECTDDWLANVASTGTFTKAASMNDWPTGASGIPAGWTVVDA